MHEFRYSKPRENRCVDRSLASVKLRTPVDLFYLHILLPQYILVDNLHLGPSILYCLGITLRRTNLLPRYILFLQLAATMSGHSSDNDVEENERAGWEGSEVSAAEIAWLRRTQRIPMGVECRRPSDENEPTPAAGEQVVFVAHFERGFGLPASSFF